MTNDNNSLILANPFNPSDALVAELLADRPPADSRTEDQKIHEAISEVLQKLGGLTVKDDELVFEGTKFILPAQYQGRLSDVMDFLHRYEQQQTKKFSFSRTMQFRPDDGAHAFMEVMRRITGTTGLGVDRMTFFGPQPPEFKSIDIDLGKTVQVPWGLTAFPTYDATFDVGAVGTEEGVLFRLAVSAPKKHRQHIEAIFGLVEKELRENSIYRGKAITGAEWPTFVDTTRVDPRSVVYSAHVMAQLEAHIWTPIRHSEAMRRQNIPLRRAVLFAGPYGTGKSLGAMLTAQEAVKAGWTFVMCRTGQDDPATVLRTAALYAPAVVVIEDLDVHAAGTSAVEISRLLEMLDGISNKGVEVIALFTTNRIEMIQKGALRPGRLDAVIEIDGLDRAAFEKLITRTLGLEWLEADIKWEEVAVAFQDFLPAFVVEAARRAMRFAMARNQGVASVISTGDLCHAADSLRPQLDLMNGAREGARPVTIEDRVSELVENVLRRTTLPDHSDKFEEIDERTVLNGGVK